MGSIPNGIVGAVSFITWLFLSYYILEVSWSPKMLGAVEGDVVDLVLYSNIFIVSLKKSDT